MTRLPAETYLSHVRSESARFREVIAGCDPAARVPSCPDWTAADLLWHLATVQRWWAEVVTARPARPEEIDPPRPESYDDLLAAYDEWSGRLAEVLESADPADEAWNWSDDHTVGGEHGVEVGADGVHEVLDVMYGGCPPWGTWTPGEGTVRVDATDTGDQHWVRFGVFAGTDPDSGTSYADEEDFHVVDPPDDEAVEPDAVVDGPAAALDLWLWSRGDDADLSVVGDQDVLARFRAVVDSPID